MQLDLGTILGIAGILIGAFFSYYFYRISLREKKPTWAVRSIVLIEDFCEKFENLKVLYKNETVANLTVSKIAFWNEGKDTIDRTDIETVNHLRIECAENIKILDTKILVCNNYSSQFSVNLSDDQKYANIEFDYIDNKQGAVIQVVHTGRSSEDLRIAGNIKGVNYFTNRFTSAWFIRWLRNKLPKPSKNFSNGMLIVLGFVLLFMLIINFLYPEFFDPKTEFSSGLFTGFNLIIALLSLYIGFFGERKIVPKSLEIFYE